MSKPTTGTGKTAALPSKETTKKMSYKTTKYAIFADAMVKLSITTPGDLSGNLGYSRSAHNMWRKSGRLPKTAALACECLLRRQNKEKDETPVYIYFLTVPKMHILAIESFCKSLGIAVQVIAAAKA